MTKIDEIRGRVEKATLGPWEADYIDTNHFEIFSRNKDAERYFIVSQGNENGDDLDFIAHAREDIPYLLGVIDELVEGIAQRTYIGHNDTCGWVVSDEGKYPCTCGHNKIKSLLSKIKGEGDE
jgi:hypothetical protein